MSGMNACECHKRCQLTAECLSCHATASFNECDIERSSACQGRPDVSTCSLCEEGECIDQDGMRFVRRRLWS